MQQKCKLPKLCSVIRRLQFRTFLLERVKRTLLGNGRAMSITSLHTSSPQTQIVGCQSSTDIIQCLCATWFSMRAIHTVVGARIGLPQNKQYIVIILNKYTIMRLEPTTQQGGGAIIVYISLLVGSFGGHLIINK